AALVFDDAKTRSQFYDLLQSLGDHVGEAVSPRIPGAAPVVQRELLALLGRLPTLPAGFSARAYLDSEEPLVRREAVRLLFRSPSERDGRIMGGFLDPGDRCVFCGRAAGGE